LTELFPMVQRY